MCDAVSLPSPSLLWLNAAHFSHKATPEHRSCVDFTSSPPCSFPVIQPSLLFCLALPFISLEREKREGRGICVDECTRWVRCTPGHMYGSQRQFCGNSFLLLHLQGFLSLNPNHWIYVTSANQTSSLVPSCIFHLLDTCSFFVMISTGSRSPLLYPSPCSLEAVDFHAASKGKGCGLHRWDSLHYECRSSQHSCEHTKAFWVQSVTSSTAVCSVLYGHSCSYKAPVPPDEHPCFPYQNGNVFSRWP